MVHFEKEIKEGVTYVRVSHRARVNGKSKRVWSVWLGREDKILERARDIKAIFELEFEPVIRDYGLPVVLLKKAEQLDLINIINECTAKRDQGLSVGHYILIATLQRCIKPQSKVHIRDWFHSTHLQHVFPEITTYLDSLAYSNHYHYLTKEAIEEIETRITVKLRTEFNVEMKELFFDPTNLFTFTNPRRENQVLFGHGHSKEGRHSLNLINLSLLCTRDGGIPVMHCTYPGGVHDAVHFKHQYPKILERLEKLGISPQVVILVFDKGNISPEIFQVLDESEMYWICSVRPSVHKDLALLTPDEFPRFELPNGKKIGVLEFQRPMFSRAALKKSTVPGYENPDRRLIVQYNPRRAKWNGKNFTRKLEARMAEVDHFFKGPEQRLANPGKFPKWKKRDAVEAKIIDILTSKGKKQYMDYIFHEVKSLQPRGPREGVPGIQYEIGVKKEALEGHLKTLGKSYYMTNLPAMPGPEIIWLYRQQFNVERAFRYLKNPDSIRIRPMFVYTDDSVRGFNFTCVLGLLLLSLVTREVRGVFPEMGLPAIRELLSEIKVVEIEFPGIRIKKQKIVKLSPEAKKLADFYKLGNLIA